MNAKMIRATALSLALLALTPRSHSAELRLPPDGWASWQVDAVEGAPAMCCWSSWDAREPSRKACRLDDGRGNFGSRDHEIADAVRVYARMAGGKVERLRVLSASCPVESATPIRDLGNVATDDSTRWLIGLSKGSTGAGMSDDWHENVLAGLAMHRGDLAQNELTAIARGNGPAETRMKAVFWLAHLRGAPGAEVATDLMFNDKDPELRQHAAFAITQSKSPRVTEDLIRLGNTDKDGEVRAQAWFWLAQSGAPESEAAIVAALKKDHDDNVREQAIFALSQLPDERATRALIAAAEDRSLSSEQRKRAVFWLAQSDSKGAQKYLEKVLAGNSAN
jgi:HEAT repeats